MDLKSIGAKVRWIDVCTPKDERWFGFQTFVEKWSLISMLDLIGLNLGNKTMCCSLAFRNTSGVMFSGELLAQTS